MRKLKEVESDSSLILDILQDIDISMELKLDLVDSLEYLDIPFEGDKKMASRNI